MVRFDQFVGHNQVSFHISFKFSQLIFYWQELFQDQVQFWENLIRFGN